jgi:hypothetical protein
MQPPHLSLAEVKHRMMTDQSAMVRQRWLIIYNALVEPVRLRELRDTVACPRPPFMR